MPSRSHPLLPQIDAAGLAADAAVAALWRELLAVIAERHGYRRDYERALAVLRKLPGAVAGVLTHRLASLYRHAHQGAARAVAQSVPPRVLARAVPVTEAARPGTVALFARAGRLRAADLARQLRDPSPLPDQEQRDLFAELLMPAPTEQDVLAFLAPLIRPQDYHALGDAERRLPEQLAQQLATDLSLGKSQRETAEGLLPFLDGSRVRARRAARTLGIHTAHSAQMAAWQGLGDMLIGYTLHSVKGPYTRKWHAARDGREYYINPKPGQDGMDKCPHPPLEPADPSERPPGTPRTAWNCL